MANRKAPTPVLATAKWRCVLSGNQVGDLEPDKSAYVPSKSYLVGLNWDMSSWREAQGWGRLGELWPITDVSILTRGIAGTCNAIANFESTLERSHRPIHSHRRIAHQESTWCQLNTFRATISLLHSKWYVALVQSLSLSRHQLIAHLQAGQTTLYKQATPRAARDQRTEKLTALRSILFRNNFTMLGAVFASAFALQMYVPSADG